MARKRPVDSGEKDALGRTIRVAGDHAERRPSAPVPVDADGEAPSLTDEQWSDLWEMSEEISRQAARKFGVDADEVRSMTMIAMGGMRGEAPTNMRAYLYTVARNAAWRICYDTKEGTGYRRLLEAKAQLARLVSARGGSLTDADVAELAGTVTVSGSRLPDGWHMWGRSSGDDALAAVDARTADGFEDRLVEEVDTDDRVALATRHAETGTGSKWDQLAEAFDAPPASKGSMSENSAPRVREWMREAGGLGALIRKWDSLELDAAGERALFGPWGKVRTADEAGSPHYWVRWQPPSATDQERVVDALRRVGPLAEDAWSAALSDATWVVQRARPRRAKPRAV